MLHHNHRIYHSQHQAISPAVHTTACGRLGPAAAYSSLLRCEALNAQPCVLLWLRHMGIADRSPPG
jgi:hypothetical protein